MYKRIKVKEKKIKRSRRLKKNVVYRVHKIMMMGSGRMVEQQGKNCKAIKKR